jgi:DNA-binding response OmpR family regulator
VRRSHEELAADAARGEQPLTIHGVEIDPAKRRVRVRGRDIELTNQEFTLLLLFAEHPGIVFSREALLEKIWKGDTYVTERSVDTLVKRLRHKVEDDPANPALILTQWGVGYKFADLA